MSVIQTTGGADARVDQNRNREVIGHKNSHSAVQTKTKPKAAKNDHKCIAYEVLS